MKNKLLNIRYALLGFICAFAFHSMPISGCSKDDKEDVNPIDPIVTIDIEKANQTAEEVEKAFESGDVNLIMPFLSEAALLRSEDDLKNADVDLLKQFAIDFNKRSIVGNGDEFIEYVFDWNGIPYTVDFALQADGSIKIIRL